jgi:hypothetical protein
MGIHFKRFASEEHIVRLLEVHKDIENKGKYDLTYDELVHGCGMAWRNAPRCVARVQWQSLKVKNSILHRGFLFRFSLQLSYSLRVALFRSSMLAMFKQPKKCSIALSSTSSTQQIKVVFVQL